MLIDLLVDWILCQDSVLVICDLSRDDYPGRAHWINSVITTRGPIKRADLETFLWNERSPINRRFIFSNEISMADCIENGCLYCFVDRAWFCGRSMVYLCFWCLVMSHFVTLSIIRIEVSHFTLALISRILIYIQTASLRLADDRVGVGIPTRWCSAPTSTVFWVVSINWERYIMTSESRPCAGFPDIQWRWDELNTAKISHLSAAIVWFARVNAEIEIVAAKQQWRGDDRLSEWKSVWRYWIWRIESWRCA